MNHSLLMRQFSYLLLLTLSFIIPVFGEETEKKDILLVFEKLDKSNEWSAVGEVETLADSDLVKSDYLISDYLQEYSVKAGYQCEFERQKDSVLIKITIYKLDNQRLAFGFYSKEKSPSLRFYDIGFESYSKGLRLISWYGTYIIHVVTLDTTNHLSKYVEDVGKNCVRFLPKQKKVLPVLDALPKKDGVEYSEKFYRQRWLDQKYFKNIYYADYYTPEGYSRIFIIDNITTATADSNFWKFYDFCKNHGEILNDSLKVATDYFVVDEPLWGKTILAKKNQIIYGVLNFRNKRWTEDRLDEILNQLKKRKVVKSG